MVDIFKGKAAEVETMSDIGLVGEVVGDLFGSEEGKRVVPIKGRLFLGLYLFC